MLFSIAVLAIVGLSFILHVQIYRYQLDDIHHLSIQNPQSKIIQKGQVLDLILWNISYGGMPEDIGFFYSGGTQLLISENRYNNNFQKILSDIDLAQDSVDFLFLQKVDTSSKRSYYDNQINKLHSVLPEFEYSYCLNFSNPFIPVPIDQPIGEVHSGLMTLSRYKAVQSKRIPLDSRTFYWPKRLFTAQRCMSLTTYRIGSKNLHLINAHLDSYDYQGAIRLAQLQQVWQLADSLEKRGDYVILAGGWNMNPPGFKKFRIKNGYLGQPSYPEIDSSMVFQNWKFEYRMDIPTNRSIREGYRHGAISTSIKDFFICSPNVAVLEADTKDQKFKNSDHQTVFIKVYLFPK